MFIFSDEAAYADIKEKVLSTACVLKHHYPKAIITIGAEEEIIQHLPQLVKELDCNVRIGLEDSKLLPAKDGSFQLARSSAEQIRWFKQTYEELTRSD